MNVRNRTCDCKGCSGRCPASPFLDEALSTFTKGRILAPHPAHPGSHSLPQDHAPGEGGDGGPYAVNCPSLSIKAWPSCLHSGQFWRALPGPELPLRSAQGSKAVNFPFCLVLPSSLPKAAASSTQIWVSKLASWVTQTTTNNYKEHICKEVSLKHQSWKQKLGVSNYHPEDKVFELRPYRDII